MTVVRRHRMTDTHSYYHTDIHLPAYLIKEGWMPRYSVNIWMFSCSQNHFCRPHLWSLCCKQCQGIWCIIFTDQAVRYKTHFFINGATILNPVLCMQHDVDCFDCGHFIVCRLIWNPNIIKRDILFKQESFNVARGRRTKTTVDSNLRHHIIVVFKVSKCWHDLTSW